MIWSHELEDGSRTPATAFGKYLVNSNNGILQFRRSNDGELVQEITGENFNNWSRVIVIDSMILASKGSQIAILTPEASTSEELPFQWRILGNPVNTKITLEITSETPKDIDYRVLGANGDFTAVSGRLYAAETSLVDIDVSTLGLGNYIIQLIYKNKIYQKSFLIKDSP